MTPTNSIPIVDVAGLLEHMADMHAAGIVPMVYGAPGIGKSEIVAQYAAQIGAHLLDVRLSYLLPESIGPIFYPIAAEERVQAFTPALVAQVRKLRAETGKPVLIFLDELTLASRDTLSVALELLLESRIAGERVPDDTLIIAAGNRPEDTAGAIFLDGPQKSRVGSVLFQPTLDDLSAYIAKRFPKNALASAMCGFLATPAAAQIAGRTVHADGIAPIFTNRGVVRSIQAMMPIIGKASMAQIVDNRRAMRIMESLVGTEFAAKFSAFAAIAEQVTSPRDILAKPNRAKLPTSQEAIIAQLSAIHAELVANSYDSKMIESFHTYLERFDRADNVRVWVMTLSKEAQGALSRTIRGKRIMQTLSVDMDVSADAAAARGL